MRKLFTVAFACVLAAPPVSAHGFYTGWMMPTHPSKSCCNEKDCEAVTAYKDLSGTYWALIERRWREIPKAIILDPTKPENKSPGGYHACWDRDSKELLCFREEEVKM